jgi:hypothetical protein
MLNQAVSRSGSQATLSGAVFGFRLSSRPTFPYPKLGLLLDRRSHAPETSKAGCSEFAG